MRHRVLGTAGHIDHGKSALVLALTGTDPDRLKEEQLRGITIELGFADLDLGQERTLAIVDVPGHERFVRHMVAGATGIDAVMLVVAADQAVQPQTREHLEICRLLGVERGVIALTKSDLVDEELLEVSELEVRELVAGTFLANAPLVAVSARTEQGLDRLRQALSSLFDELPERGREGVARLPVDRSFVLRGFGAVVTGTLASGELAEGDEVEILPEGHRARVRGLQVHKHRQDRVWAGQRTAINLQGVDSSQVPRGATVTSPGALRGTRRLWAWLELLPSAPKRLQRGGTVRFHQGTCERGARLRVLGEAGAGRLQAELFLDEPAVVVPGDRFILRCPAPVDTVAGGWIVDIFPPRAATERDAAFASHALELHEAILLRLRRAGVEGRGPAELRPELGLSVRQLGRAEQELTAKGKLVVVGGRWYDGGVWLSCRSAILDTLDDFHGRHPLRLGLAREELRSRAAPKLGQDALRHLLEQLAGAREVELRGEHVTRSGHSARLSAEDRDMLRRIERGLADGGLDPPLLESLTKGEDATRVRDLVALLIDEGKVERIQDGRLFHAEPLARLRAKLRDYARTSRRIDVPTFKQLAGVTRKNAIPLLEQFDAERTTLRVGDLREILVRPDPPDLSNRVEPPQGDSV